MIDFQPKCGIDSGVACPGRHEGSLLLKKVLGTEHEQMRQEKDKHGGRIRHLRVELCEHLPYTIFSVAVGLAVMGLLTAAFRALDPDGMPEAVRGLFHIFHPLHVLFSATATTAMFWRHERRMAKAVLVGVAGATGICSISDIVMPYLAGLLLGVQMEFHLCVIHHPVLVVPFAAIGIAAGLLVSPGTNRGTIFSHSAHVMVSSMASILYLVSFGMTDWFRATGLVFIYMILAVMLPCCSSDIVFPLLLARPRRHAAPAPPGSP